MKKNILLISLLLLFYLTKSYAASISFKVNMSLKIQKNQFNTNSDFIDIAGSFNDWGNNLTKLTDSESDQIYEIELDGFDIDEVVVFKFRINGEWNGTEEFPGVGNNREYKVQNADNIFECWFNNDIPPDGPIQADFTTPFNEIYSFGEIQFFDKSAGEIIQWDWEFRGAKKKRSKEQNPKVMYTKPGKYDVKLTVCSKDKRSKKIKKKYITVLDQDKKVLSWWNEVVFYEIFVRSFYDSDGDGIGDVNGLIQKLDYLNDGDPNTNDDLGVTGIWLMPINDSPSYHGYDVIDYKSINPDYGSMDDFILFLKEAHKRGIKVIIDYVMNHCSTQNKWFIDASSDTISNKRNWFRWSDFKPGIKGPWNQDVWHFSKSGYYYGLFWGGMPDLNYNEQAVQDTMFAIADYWLENVGIDGFRLDAVKFIYEEGNKLEDTKSTIQFWKKFRRNCKQSNKESITVGEAWTNTEKIVKYVENDGLDICFEFDLAGQIIDALNSGNSTRLKEHLNKINNTYPHQQWAAFLSNHDQNRIINYLMNDMKKMKAASAILLTLPGTPFLYYGEEIGMSGSKPDENIRRPMQWNSEKNSGFTEGIPWNQLNKNYKKYNVDGQQKYPFSLLSWYKYLISKRNKNKALQIGDYQEIKCNDIRILAFYRKTDNDCFYIVINISDEDISNPVFKNKFLSKQISFLKPYEVIIKKNLISRKHN